MDGNNNVRARLLREKLSKRARIRAGGSDNDDDRQVDREVVVLALLRANGGHRFTQFGRRFHVPANTAVNELVADLVDRLKEEREYREISNMRSYSDTNAVWPQVLPWKKSAVTNLRDLYVYQSYYHDCEAPKDRRNDIFTATDQTQMGAQVGDLRFNKRSGVAVVVVNATRGGKFTTKKDLDYVKRLLAFASRQSYQTVNEAHAAAERKHFAK